MTFDQLTDYVKAAA